MENSSVRPSFRSGLERRPNSHRPPPPPPPTVSISKKKRRGFVDKTRMKTKRFQIHPFTGPSPLLLLLPPIVWLAGHSHDASGDLRVTLFNSRTNFPQTRRREEEGFVWFFFFSSSVTYFSHSFIVTASSSSPPRVSPWTSTLNHRRRRGENANSIITSIMQLEGSFSGQFTVEGFGLSTQQCGRSCSCCTSVRVKCGGGEFATLVNHLNYSPNWSNWEAPTEVVINCCWLVGVGVSISDLDYDAVWRFTRGSVNKQ